MLRNGFKKTFSLCLLAAACFSHYAIAEEATTQDKRIGIYDYQNFLVNWDESKNPSLYAYIQTAAQYEALFHPAPVMGKQRPFAPPAERFEKEAIILVAKVMPMNKQAETSLNLEKIETSADQLTFSYRFDAPPAASARMNNFIAFWVPKNNFQTIRLLENGKLIGELSPAKGKWVFPEQAAHPAQ